jgi:hypothetical protein
MLEYSPKVRRNQTSIVTRHRKSNVANQTLRISDNVDKQRNAILRLEEEKFWLDSEIQALRKQVNEIDERIDCERSKRSQHDRILTEISRLTAQILLFSCNFVLTDEEAQSKSKSTATPRNDRTGDEASVGIRSGNGYQGAPGAPTIDHNLSSVSSETPRSIRPIVDTPGKTIDTSAWLQNTQLCSAIIDSPPDGREIDEYVNEYADLIRRALFLSPNAVSVSGSCIDSEEKDALRVLLVLTMEDALRLGDYIEGIAGSSSEGLAPTSKAIMEVTRAVIIDADPNSPSNKIVARKSLRSEEMNPKISIAEPDTREREPIVDSSTYAEGRVVDPLKNTDSTQRQETPIVKDLVQSLERKVSSENGMASSTSMFGLTFRRSNFSLNLQKTLDSVADPPISEPEGSLSESSEANSDLDGTDMDEGVSHPIKIQSSSIGPEPANKHKLDDMILTRKGWGVKAPTPSRRLSSDEQSTKRSDTLVVDPRPDANTTDEIDNTRVPEPSKSISRATRM